MRVELIDYMGNDLMVVNAARVSFDKASDWDYVEEAGEDDYGAYLVEVRRLKKTDEKLIKYLATHNHWTPFSHPQVTVRVKAPIFVARQLFKHKVGLVENEISRRYVDDPPEFYTPQSWRGRPTDGAKQGSSGILELPHLDERLKEVHDFCLNHYLGLLADGAAPEQARMVLPQSMMTSWYWTGSLAAFARVCNLRFDPHAQAETREVAQMISSIIEPLFPVSWGVLINKDNNIEVT